MTSARLTLMAVLALAVTAVLGAFAHRAQDLRREGALEELARQRATVTKELVRERAHGDSLGRAATASVALATHARARVRIDHATHTVAVDGGVPMLVPAVVTDIIDRQDRAISVLQAKVRADSTTIARQDSVIALGDRERRLLAARVPRFGFRAGVAVGVVGTVAAFMAVAGVGR